MTITWSIGGGRSWKNRCQGSRVVGVEGRGALRAEFGRRLLEPVGIAGGEDDIGTLGPGAPGGLEPDARAAADHDDGLPGQFRFALGRKPAVDVCRLVTGPPAWQAFGHLRVHRAARLARGMSAICMRSAITAAS